MDKTDLMRALTALGSIPIERVEEICAAERDGRCVVLPCKVGDTVYEPCGHEVLSLKVHGFNIEAHIGGGTRTVDSIGKTVFLTREEAEAALAKEGGQEE